MRTLRKGARRISLVHPEAILEHAAIFKDTYRMMVIIIGAEEMAAYREAQDKSPGMPRYCAQVDNYVLFDRVADKQYPVELHLMLRVVE